MAAELGVFFDEHGKRQQPKFPDEHGQWELDGLDCLLYALLSDNIYCPELMWEDGSNREYSGCYRVRDYQYPLFRVQTNYAGFACARSTGKTESIKAKSFTHAFRRLGEDRVLSAPELIHLLPLTDAIESRINSTRLTRDFLDVRNGKSGFTHRPFGVNYLDGTSLIGRIPRLDGRGVKGMHAPDVTIDECFPAGTLILTKRGQVPIESIQTGDRVLTHRGRWRAVTATTTRRRATVRLTGQGHPGLISSENHPFWTRQLERRGTRSRDGHQRRVFGEARFVQASSLAPADGHPSDNAVRVGAEFWASPCRFPPAPTPSPPEAITINDDFWWLLGFYMAEGCVHQELRQVTFSIHRDEVQMLQKRLTSIGLQSSAYPDEQGAGVRVCPRHARSYSRWLVKHVGRIAAEHEVKPWLLGQPEEIRRLVLDGYVTGDGNMVKDERYAAGRWQAACAERKLALSIKLLAQSLDYFVALYWSNPYETSIKGRPVHGRGWFQIRANRRSQSAFEDDAKHFARVAQAEPTGQTEKLYDLTVADDHSFVAEGLVCSNSQDYPEKGWTEIHEVVMKDHVDQDGNSDFIYEFYGVHSGARDTGFYKRATQGGFKIIQITALQRPGWCAAEKEAAKAAYGGTSSPDYRRNILGEPGAAASPLFVSARLIACMDQNRESVYNQQGYRYQELRVEEFDELMLPIADVLELPSGLKRVWAGMDIGLTVSPTVILIFSEETVSRQPRLKLVRRIHLQRFAAPQIRAAVSAIGAHFGDALQGFGMDVTGLGLPIFQDIERDEAVPPVILERAKGYFFNAKVPVGVAREHVTQDSTGNLRDQYGSAVTEVIVPLTGERRYVVSMPMIEASTKYLREFVDKTFMLLPFDPAVIGDMQGDTAQRLKRIVGLKNKPNAYHILDAMRAMSMVYKDEEVQESLALEAQAPVLDLAMDDNNVYA